MVSWDTVSEIRKEVQDLHDELDKLRADMRILVQELEMFRNTTHKLYEQLAKKYTKDENR